MSQAKTVSEQLVRLTTQLQQLEPRYRSLQTQYVNILADIQALAMGGAASKESLMVEPKAHKVYKAKTGTTLGSRIITVLALQSRTLADIADELKEEPKKVGLSLFHLRRAGTVSVANDIYSLSPASKVTPEEEIQD